MTRRRLWLTALIAGLLAVTAGPAAAGVAPESVSIDFASFAPQQLDVLPGETVVWTNMSERTHTVTADDGSFDSGNLAGSGTYSLRFATPGMYMYHCQIHPGMTGEIDVRRLILDPLPTAPVLRGHQVTVTGRSADATATVQIQRATAGGYETIATVTPRPDGTWSATLTGTASSDLRAVSGGDVSETRRLLVIDRTLHVRLAGHRLDVNVAPLSPGQQVVLEYYRRERFGWWPTTWRRLDYASRATFQVHGPARVRVELLDRDGWTPLVVSPVLRVKSRSRG
jgi:plastocyanin